MNPWLTLGGACVLLCCRAPQSAPQSAPDAGARKEWAATEAEAIAGAELHRERRLLASGQAAVELGSADQSLIWVPPALPAGPGTFYLRAARRGPPLLLSIDAPGMRTTLRIQDTGHWDRFQWFALALPSALQGALRIGGGKGPVLLDCLRLLPASAPPPDLPALHSRDGWELRPGEDARIFDPPWVFSALRRQEAFVAHALGFPRNGVLVLGAIADAHWPDPSMEAFQSGRVVYLRASRLHLLWRGYTHELVHLFQDQCETAVPWYFHEGVATHLAQRADLELWDRREVVARNRSLLAEVRAQGNNLYRPHQGANPIFGWNAGGEMPRAKDAYDWAAAIIDALVEESGPGLLPKAYALLRDPAHPGARALREARDGWQRSAILCELLSEAAGTDLKPRFAAFGLPAAEGRP